MIPKLTLRAIFRYWPRPKIQKLRKVEHIKKKKVQLNIEIERIIWLNASKSKLPTYNKLFTYKQIMKTVWHRIVEMCKAMPCQKVSSFPKQSNKKYCKCSMIKSILIVKTMISCHVSKPETRFQQQSNIESLLPE